MRFKKLKWERVDGSYDLICLNPNQLNMKTARKLLRKIEGIYADFKKQFSKKALKLWQEWIENPKQPLQEEAYCLLSNWFLVENSASISIRAGLALLLWHKLFCAIPDNRLTVWEISDEKVIPEEFNKWWKKQLKCQEDC